MTAVEEHLQAEPVADAAEPHAAAATNGGPPAGAPEQHPLPVMTLDEALPLLRRPFTPEAIRWKVQSTFGDKGCMVVGYVDARLVIERLNLVAGSLWSADYDPLPDGLMLCRLTVDGVTRQDVGSGYKGKGLYSDALKRAAVHFGVAVSVYALPQIRLWLSEHGPEKKGWIETFKDGKGKTQFRLTEKGTAALRKGYERWLEDTGIEAFGQPIYHGDVEDSAGDEAETAPAQSEVNDLPAVKQPLVDAKADQLRSAIRVIYEKVDKRKLPAARFESELRQASTSHDELETFAAKLREMAA